ncbi:hypothetical protein JMK10_21955 [Rhodovulum sulfidophilum]|uniref:toxin-antitoxin system YwqK family antitoxin n=1 Tax=Rhodovulum sulfidophilum TaxID=35806 RepID=UPI001923B2C0|nr:hypothetical protein [Rhodovulum sulfidophilum]MBL3574156.1 hypothetical protein [Rhodovulum sulfidophilum]MCE8431793.1 hypothetical protein [Rhodovulum sulfidophilum]MCF4119313.1 hypothetical protein [Rhodovulum sulfidophilum]
MIRGTATALALLLAVPGLAAPETGAPPAEAGVAADGQAADVRTEHWPSGKLRSQRHFVDGREVGLSRRWSREGALIRETRFSDDGKVLHDRHWKDGKLVHERLPVTVEGHGAGEKIVERYGSITETDIRAEGYRLTTRHRGDELIDRSEVIDGQIQGRYILTGRIDNDVSRVTYVDNQPHGLFTRTWRGETLERGMYDHGTRIGEWLRTERYGTAIHEVYDPEGRLDGTRREIGANGQLRRLETYVHGTLDGPWEERDREGRLLSGGAYSEGQKTGPWREGGPHGEEYWQGSYVAGLRNGPWERFDAQGYRLERVRYEDGTRDGLRYLFRPDGAVGEVQSWKNGERDGYTTRYEDGLPVGRDLWRDGRPVATGLSPEAE